MPKIDSPLFSPRSSTLTHHKDSLKLSHPAPEILQKSWFGMANWGIVWYRSRTWNDWLVKILHPVEYSHHCVWCCPIQIKSKYIAIDLSYIALYCIVCVSRVYFCPVKFTHAYCFRETVTTILMVSRYLLTRIAQLHWSSLGLADCDQALIVGY